jgi:hypothetical protein
MGRNRLHETDAERQRAYRLRHRAGLVGLTPAPPPRPRRPTRPRRLAAAEGEIRGLLREYEGWLAALPPSLESSDQAAKLTETIDQLASVADAIAEIEPPRGFGRD